MKTFIFLASLLFIASGCDTASEQPKEEKATTVLVFIRDASQSVRMDADEKTQLEKWLKQYFLEALEPNTDVLLMSVNENSNSVANHQFFRWTFDKQQSADEYKSETDKLMDESMKESEDQTQKITLMVSLLKSLRKDSLANANRSLIIEMIPEILRLTKDYSSLRIVYYSDMIQEGERSFIKTPLRSKSIAESYGKEDANELINQFGIQTQGLKKVKSIQVLLPSNVNPKTLNNIQFYYTSFFRSLKCNVEPEWNVLK